jgi:hypothetical protein
MAAAEKHKLVLPAPSSTTATASMPCSFRSNNVLIMPNAATQHSYEPTMSRASPDEPSHQQAALPATPASRKMQTNYRGMA